MSIIMRDGSGKPTVWCDPCLEPLIRALNENGLPTIASCCGHDNQPGRVTLRDGTDLIVTDFTTASSFFERYGN